MAAALDLVLEVVAVLDHEGLVEVAAALDLVLEVVAALDQRDLVEVAVVLTVLVNFHKDVVGQALEHGLVKAAGALVVATDYLLVDYYIVAE